jgi:hypothetical protein
LNPCVCDLTFFLRVEFFPLLIVKFLIERYQISVKKSKHSGEGRIGERTRDWCLLALDEINKRIAHVAFVLKIYREVEKIIGALVAFVHGSQEHSLTVLIWYVFDHESGA